MIDAHDIRLLDAMAGCMRNPRIDNYCMGGARLGRMIEGQIGEIDWPPEMAIACRGHDDVAAAVGRASSPLRYHPMFSDLVSAFRRAEGSDTNDWWTIWWQTND